MAVSQVISGLMVPRNLPGRQRKLKQLSWSAEVLFRVLEQHEPRHPLLIETYRQAAHVFVTPPAQFLDRPQFDWKLRELARSPFAFPIYASVIKESMISNPQRHDRIIVGYMSQNRHRRGG